MPAGKYHCDYCEKEFRDTPAARRRHLQSKPHLRAKSLWFHTLSLRDALPPDKVPSSASMAKGESVRGGSWGHLPPSLKPPPDGGFHLQMPFVDWG